MVQWCVTMCEPAVLLYIPTLLPFRHFLQYVAACCAHRCSFEIAADALWSDKLQATQLHGTRLTVHRSHIPFTLIPYTNANMSLSYQHSNDNSHDGSNDTQYGHCSISTCSDTHSRMLEKSLYAAAMYCYPPIPPQQHFIFPSYLCAAHRAILQTYIQNSTC